MARGKFQPAEFERKWQEWWDKQGIYYASDDDPREKYYNLVMFPYPSGDLHIGHWYNYTGADIYGRFMRMRGYNVMQPIGFDAFGLPAENAAIKRNIQPRTWTLDNIAQDARAAADDGRWLGLAARGRHLPARLLHAGRSGCSCSSTSMGWPTAPKRPPTGVPHCNTTLANEQVVNGDCERCGTPVERREIDQWLLRITKYADELLRFDGMDWPEKTRLMQTQLDRAQRGRRDPLPRQSCRRSAAREPRQSRFRSSRRGPTPSTA